MTEINRRCAECGNLIDFDEMRAEVQEEGGEDNYCLTCFHENFTDEKVGEA